MQLFVAVGIQLFNLAMKLFIFFIAGLFAHKQEAETMAFDSNDIVHSRIRHWAMPNYRLMRTSKVENEFVKPEYNRLSQQRNQNLKRIMESLDGQGPRISSIWHSYTKSLF